MVCVITIGAVHFKSVIPNGWGKRVQINKKKRKGEMVLSS
jgi:hypothetical protein